LGSKKRFYLDVDGSFFLFVSVAGVLSITNHPDRLDRVRIDDNFNLQWIAKNGLVVIDEIMNGGIWRLFVLGLFFFIK
jgi:hypothetical protein